MTSPSLAQSLTLLSAELCQSLSLLQRALTEPHERNLAPVSECNRRSTSLLVDLHATLLSSFCPPLPRAFCMALAEKLYAAGGATFEASLLLPPSWRPSTRLTGELQSLCRMGELLYDELVRLPQTVKGGRAPMPDPSAFYAEQNKARSAHALYLLNAVHGEQERALLDGLGTVRRALADAYAALLVLIGESV